MTQTLFRLDEYKEILKHAAKRAKWYAERVLEVIDAVITKSIQVAARFAGGQLNAARRV